MRYLAGRLTPDQAELVEANLAAQESALSEHDLGQIVTLDAEFHILYSRFLGNQEIIRAMEQLREKIHRVILRVNAEHPERLAVGVAEHRGIAQAVMVGDAALAVRRVEEHLEYGKQYLLSPRGL